MENYSLPNDTQIIVRIIRVRAAQLDRKTIPNKIKIKGSTYITLILK